jgi:ribosomal protein L15
MARRPVVATRAPSRVRASSASAASKAARCRCADYAVINLDQLEALFDGGTDVNPEVLHGQGLAQGSQKIKVLGRGELTKALNVKAHKFSGAAAQKIQAAGGTVESL